ncbi:P-loop containing nucleoside triphosphate hydrolase protein [Pelagophyceae sp. CCMP2097]|nr:P-loop containing nucleoside triphosphate hydrolase protein [Pelagophyceae sp. CCMP2097]|mmetsp:Transcript_158/g.614  ORF Transcript_158/g.614 Transcript_158/m.614 type:complete len:410 (-) Transcript_158:14-1243(-)
MALLVGLLLLAARALRSHAAAPTLRTRVVAAPNATELSEAQLRRQPFGGQPCLQGRHCRPSFLIIGVGKCGTSSLYYYLTAHPSVEGASQKQLQWFDHAYQKTQFESGYLSKFPRKLSRGFMTGESSPGYVAYSFVPPRVSQHLGAPRGGGGGARYLAVVRDPADRAYSSYHYNYKMAHKTAALPFFTLVDAEIRLLEKCFAADRTDPAKGRCPDSSPDALCRHDLSEDCYNRHTVREQVGTEAAELFGNGAAAATAPANAHLWRQLVGRSLYATYLEWWYATFDAEDMLLVCLEDLFSLDAASAEMDRVSAFLALPAFDFGSVLGGKFNAGDSHAGYGAVTPWDAAPSTARPPPEQRAVDLVTHFAQPFNERLFDLAGHRCPWRTQAANETPANARRLRGRKRRDKAT